MTQASQKIMQQYKDGGVIPAQLVGQDAVSKTYVDGQISAQDAKIIDASNAANAARLDIDNHKIANNAHSAKQISYSGVATGTNVEQAIDRTNERISGIVAQAGNDNTEIVDARGGFTVLGDRLNTFVTELQNVETLKLYNAMVGEVVTTRGYYVPGDGGGGKYIIVDAGTPDDGYIISLKNGFFARLVHDGTIYARQYGVKLDNETDDTARLNAFFGIFGLAKLVVNDGIALITGTLFCKGKWRADTANNYDNSLRKLIFDNATIRYMGPADGCSAIFWNHFESTIEGFALSRLSNRNYIDMTKMWHINFTNFDVMNLYMNHDLSLIQEPIDSKSLITNVFSKGYVKAGNIKMNRLDSYINSIHFKDVVVAPSGGTPSDYCVEYFGDSSFQNITFTGCDLSYASKAVFKIHNTHSSSLNLTVLNSCYLDSAIPYVENYQYNNFNISAVNTIEAASNPVVRAATTVQQYLSQTRINNYGQSGNFIPLAFVNCAKNGDLSMPVEITSGSGKWTTGGVGVTKSWVSNAGALNGIAWRLGFPNTSMNIYFYGLMAPITAVYTYGVRFTKVSGSGVLQIATGGQYSTVDLANIADGEEVVLVGNGLRRVQITKGTELVFSINNLNNAAFTIDVLEFFILPGSHAQIGVPLHPQAKVNNTGTTAQRPTSTARAGQSYFDTTISKMIWYTGSSWVDGSGATV